ncbi:hypothetical protein D0T51_01205 [Parabacteroides sp. 52]|uniref:hypothetical protein n=1 Tax=unclassified Parabacteroides TaxID=2649774 RepID=UPI0013D582F0|nr:MULTISPECIES: hypothetical protein [unclassified Parabacteroides]MDH6533600.1 hypothetical protein [Parabacteroides sp. PM5-20]NDV54352.1 hypothetical protein [Parabacteroides sp. 52]
MKPFLSYLFGIVWLLSSCEYQIHENYVDLEKPSNPVEMGIVLNAENTGDTLVVIDRYAQIFYYLETSGLKPMGCLFRIGDQTIQQPGGSGILPLSLFALQKGNYTLTCEMYLHTGSGSIAEDMGYESYMGTFTWPLKVIDPNDSARQLKHRINAAGYLELSWDKPPVGASAFTHYALSALSEKEVIIKDIEQTSFVHQSYIGGMRWFQVYAYFNDGREPWRCGDLVLSGESLNLVMDYSRQDSILIHWTNPYHTVISIREGGTDELVKYSPERSLCIPYLPFGTKQSLLYFHVTATDPENRNEDMDIHEALVVDRSPGTCITPDQNWTRTGYNPLLKQLYASTQDIVVGWSVPSLEPTGGQCRVPDFIVGYGVSLFSEKILVCETPAVNILDGKTLQTVIRIPFAENRTITGEPVLTVDDKLLSVVTFPMKLHVYNAVLGDLEYAFELPVQHHHTCQSFIAPNGKLVYYERDTEEIGVLTLDNYLVNRELVIPVMFESWCVNPLHPEQLFVYHRGKLTQYDGVKGSVLGRWNVPLHMRVSNIDPESGLLLLYSDDKAVIFNPQSGQEVYSLSINSWPCQLLGNTLISESGYALYLGKELQP